MLHKKKPAQRGLVGGRIAEIFAGGTSVPEVAANKKYLRLVVVGFFVNKMQDRTGSGIGRAGWLAVAEST